MHALQTTRRAPTCGTTWQRTEMRCFRAPFGPHYVMDCGHFAQIWRCCIIFFWGVCCPSCSGKISYGLGPSEDPFRRQPKSMNPLRHRSPFFLYLPDPRTTALSCGPATVPSPVQPHNPLYPNALALKYVDRQAPVRINIRLQSQASSQIPCNGFAQIPDTDVSETPLPTACISVPMENDAAMDCMQIQGKSNGPPGSIHPQLDERREAVSPGPIAICPHHGRAIIPNAVEHDSGASVSLQMPGLDPPRGALRFGCLGHSLRAGTGRRR